MMMTPGQTSGMEPEPLCAARIENNGTVNTRSNLTDQSAADADVEGSD
jgi:hypothetical protein